MKNSGEGREFVERVREANDIVELIGEYLTLQRRGKRFFGLCPFHDEKTPSFSVSPDKQLFYCFGCHEGGDVFDFVMKHEGMDFRESLEHLARRVGIPLPEREQTPAEKRRRRQADRLRKVLALAARYFQYVLWETDKGSAAREYLNDRGFSEDIVKSFQLGYAPDAWDALLNALTKRGHSPQLLERAGLVSPRQEGTGHYDRFRNRLMFTICDHRGRVVGFGGRTLGDEQPKYLNSPETPVFGKRKLWYGLHRAKQAVRRKEQALVMEGYTDVLAAHQFGFEQAVASLGTALSPEQAKQLARFAPEVVIAYDADTAGGEATARGLELFENSGSRVKVIRMPDGADPDDVLREEGRQGFARLLQEARPLVEYQFETAFEAQDADTVEGRVQIVKAVAPWLARMDNAVEQSSYIQLFAEKLGIDEAAFRQEIAGSGRQPLEKQGSEHRTSHRRYNSTVIPSQSELAEKEKVVPGYVKAERCLIRLMLQNESYAARIRESLSEDGLISAGSQQVYGAIVEFIDENNRVPEPAELMTCLNDEDMHSRLSRMLMEEQEAENGEQLIDGYIETIREHQLLQKLNRVQKKIVQLEQEGCTVSSELLQEYDDLNRTLKGMTRTTNPQGERGE